MIEWMIHFIYEWDKSSNYQNIKNILSTSVSFIFYVWKRIIVLGRINTTVQYTTEYQRQKSKYVLNQSTDQET